MDKSSQHTSLDSRQQYFVFFLALFSEASTQRDCQDEKDAAHPACLEDWTPALRQLCPQQNQQTDGLWTSLEEMRKEWGHAWSPWWSRKTGLPSAYSTCRGPGVIECLLDKPTESAGMGVFLGWAHTVWSHNWEGVDVCTRAQRGREVRDHSHMRPYTHTHTHTHAWSHIPMSLCTKTKNAQTHIQLLGWKKAAIDTHRDLHSPSVDRLWSDTTFLQLSLTDKLRRQWECRPLKGKTTSGTNGESKTLESSPLVISHSPPNLK